MKRIILFCSVLVIGFCGLFGSISTGSAIDFNEVSRISQRLRPTVSVSVDGESILLKVEMLTTNAGGIYADGIGMFMPLEKILDNESDQYPVLTGQHVEIAVTAEAEVTSITATVIERNTEKAAGHWKKIGIYEEIWNQLPPGRYLLNIHVGTAVQDCNYTGMCFVWVEKTN